MKERFESLFEELAENDFQGIEALEGFLFCLFEEAAENPILREKLEKIVYEGWTLPVEDFRFTQKTQAALEACGIEEDEDTSDYICEAAQKNGWRITPEEAWEALPKERKAQADRETFIAAF